MTKTTCKRGHPWEDRTKHGACRLCVNMQAQAWRESHQKFYRDRVIESSWKKHGILNFTPLDYDRMYQVQQGKCAICKKHSSEFTRRLAVDHDHITGKIRGLLCGYCNTHLAVFENKTFREAAQNYLENH